MGFNSGFKGLRGPDPLGSCRAKNKQTNRHLLLQSLMGF